MMESHIHERLLKYCHQYVPFGAEDEEKIKFCFKLLVVKKKGFLLKEGKVCQFIAYVESGIIRHYHIKDGNEMTCDITLADAFITDIKSFTKDLPSGYYFQALQDTRLLVISKPDLLRLYDTHKTIETFGRLMAENIAQRVIDMAMILASDKPEERVDKLLKQQPELFQLVPQKYLANLIGITPESFSRIRARKKG